MSSKVGFCHPPQQIFSLSKILISFDPTPLPFTNKQFFPLPEGWSEKRWQGSVVVPWNGRDLAVSPFPLDTESSWKAHLWTSSVFAGHVRHICQCMTSLGQNLDLCSGAQGAHTVFCIATGSQ